MTTKQTEVATVSTGQKFVMVLAFAFFLAIGGFFGFLFYSVLEIFAGVYDPVVRNICIASGVAVTALILIGVARHGAKKERRYIESTGGNASGMDFMTLYILSSTNDGAGSGGSSVWGGSDGGGWGGGGGDFGGSGGSDSGGSF